MHIIAHSPFHIIIITIIIAKRFLLTNLFSLCRWSVGSLLFLLSWAVLMGPLIYAKHLISGSRLPFTAAYFGSITLTLYFAIGVSSNSLICLFYTSQTLHVHCRRIVPSNLDIAALHSLS